MFLRKIFIFSVNSTLVCLTMNSGGTKKINQEVSPKKLLSYSVSNAQVRENMNVGGTEEIAKDLFLGMKSE